MPGLLRPILLLFPERRLVNEQIRALRRVHYCRTGPGIPCKHHQPARTPRADEAVSCQLSAVSKLDRLPLVQLAPQGTFGDARRPRFLRIEPPQPLVLPYRIADGAAPVLRAEDVNLVRIPHPASRIPNDGPRLHFL